ncbi:anthranilate phosphoribosyltransferase [Tulasnella sp. JGI-2019a]|nr:anthranilate phosphoribosyltransferase [Tulasnella sp. JGI-2019a]KAG8997463.1 anthranilate phosphoribosyltransferase [Tulasnella sp. JGI-2019a]
MTGVTAFTPDSFKPLLQKLIDNPDAFTAQETRLSFHHLAQKEFGGATPVQIGAFLMALKYSGKAHDDIIISAAAEVMREYATSVNVPGAETDFVVDIVGTGGDGYNTFNVSTTAAIVAAGAGARVVKHGSKASTSASGSADILAALGCRHITPTGAPLPHIPFVFLSASNYHPSIASLAPIRKSLPFRTIFNVLGPLLNPSRPRGMVLGVYTRSLGPVFARALRDGGIERAIVVCGQEGLDEISIAGGTWTWTVQNGEIVEGVIHPTQFGIAAQPLANVTGSTPAVNAATLVALLNNAPQPDDLPPPASMSAIKDFVCLNASALLVIAGIASDYKEGTQMARESIESGKAWKAFEKFRDT